MPSFGTTQLEVAQRGTLRHMALTGRRLRELRHEEVRRFSLDRPPAGRPPSGPTAEIEPGPTTWGLLLAWLVFLPLAVALEPAPAASGPQPAWAVVLGLASIFALAFTAAGLVRSRRTGLIGSAAAAGLFLFGSIMCPVSGHHVGVGAWWFVQMAGFAALGALSLAAMRLSRSNK